MTAVLLDRFAGLANGDKNKMTQSCRAEGRALRLNLPQHQVSTIAKKKGGECRLPFLMRSLSLRNAISLRLRSFAAVYRAGREGPLCGSGESCCPQLPAPSRESDRLPSARRERSGCAPP